MLFTPEIHRAAAVALHQIADGLQTGEIELQGWAEDLGLEDCAVTGAFSPVDILNTGRRKVTLTRVGKRREGAESPVLQGGDEVKLFYPKSRNPLCRT